MADPENDRTRHAPPVTDEVDYVPVTMDDCEGVPGPFYHGTHVQLDVGDELRPGTAG